MADDRDDTTGPDERAERVKELGKTDEDRLEAVAERNETLEERLPGDEELPLTKG